MTTETNNGSTASTEGAAGTEQQQETQQQQPAAEVKPEAKVEAKAESKPVPPMPTQAPPPGCEYLYSEKDGLWHVRNIADDIEKAIERRAEQKEDAEPTGSTEAGQAVAEAITIPEHFPEQFAHDDDTVNEVKSVAGLLGERGYTAPQTQRLIDFASEIAMETGIDGGPNHPHLDNREEIEGLLRLRWGSAHDENLKACQSAAKKLGPKFVEWLDKGAGNYIPVIETLAALGRGDFSLSKDAATKEIATLRATPAMKDRYHKDHKFAVTRLRVLSEVVARGEESGAAFEARVSKVIGEQVKKMARGEALPASTLAPAPTGDPEARIKDIRSKLATAKNGSAEWRSLRESLNAEYARLYPGMQS